MDTKAVEQALQRIARLTEVIHGATDERTQLVLTLRSPDLGGGCAASWQEIADAQGITRQAAWRMYRAPKEAMPS